MEGTQFVPAAAGQSAAGVRTPGLGTLVLTVDAPAVADTGDLSSGGFAALGAASDEAADLAGAAPAAVPEPSSLLVFATGLLLGGRAVRARSRN